MGHLAIATAALVVGASAASNSSKVKDLPAACQPSANYQWICVPRRDASDAAIGGALGYCCSPAGGVNCDPINQGGACFDPNTAVDHAKYAFQKYYEKTETDGTRPNPGACNFGSSAALVPKAGCGGPCTTSLDCMTRGSYCSTCISGQCTYGASCGQACEIDGDCYQEDQGQSCRSCGADNKCHPTQ
eukprot:TRINITY_DN20740_c0_g1_i1.p1 TRINITY_DN20740_c0_g1~~TRINITY_DN20740_c0_g1_i1.p1  ORF type:complete len:218 (+),score=59.44 TRINITY_DN20740_c0_g1_i1:93-656(+)